MSDRLSKSQPMSRQQNSLQHCGVTLEPRLLLSAPAIDFEVPSRIDSDDQSSSSANRESSPFITSSIRSNNDGIIRSNVAYLHVQADDNGGERNLSYEWSVLNAPGDAEVAFSNNSNLWANRTKVSFATAGEYELRVEIKDSDGNITADQIVISVLQEPTSIDVRSLGEMIGDQEKGFEAFGQQARLSAVVYDQFGHLIEEPSRVVWTASAPGQKAAYYINDLSPVIEMPDTLERQTVLVMAGNVRQQFDVVRSDLGVGTETPLPSNGVDLTTSVSIGANRNVQSDQVIAEIGSHEVSISGLIADADSTTIRVSNQVELQNALASAKSGDVILLAADANFGDLKIYKPTHLFSGTVTIRSEDPLEPATLSSVVLVNVQNLSIENVTIASDRYAAVAVSGSSNIRLLNSDVTGGLDPNLQGQDLVMGVDLRNSQHIELVGNDFYNLGTGVSVAHSEYVLVENSVFKDNLKDNLNIGSNVADILVRRNTLSSSVAKLYPEHHYDNIQLWVQKDATQDSRNITISENVILDLTGAVQSQAIFGRAHYLGADGDPSLYGFKNVNVSNNLIVTQHANAIVFAGVEGLLVDSNTLVYAGQSMNPSAVSIPGIRYSLSGNVEVSGNILPERFGYPIVDTDEFRDNELYRVGLGVGKLLVNPHAQQFSLSNFATLPKVGGGLASRPTGAFVVSGNADRPTALFVMSSHADNGQFSYSFDATASIPQSGSSLENATYQWTFADGSKASGPVIEKTFDQAGLQSVTLVVIDQNGFSSTFVKEGIAILDSNVLVMDFEQGLVDLSSTASHLEGAGSSLFVERSDGGNGIVVGSDRGHLYVDPSDSDFAGIAMTREVTVGMTIQAEARSDGRYLELANRHGSWNIRIDNVTGEMHLSLNGEFHRFTPPVDLLDGQWHDLVFTATEEKFTFFIEGQAAHEIELTSLQADTLFAKDGYGLAIGSSGPWESTRAAAFHLDDLFVSSNALSESQMADWLSDAALLS